MIIYNYKKLKIECRLWYVLWVYHTIIIVIKNWYKDYYH